MTAEHTKTPWIMSEGYGQFRAGLFGGDKLLIADFDATARTLAENRANRAFAALAVNAHGDLVAELQKVLAVLDGDEAEWWMDVQSSGGFDRDGILAALAKAGKDA